MRIMIGVYRGMGSISGMGTGGILDVIAYRIRIRAYRLIAD